MLDIRATIYVSSEEHGGVKIGHYNPDNGAVDLVLYGGEPLTPSVSLYGEPDEVRAYLLHALDVLDTIIA